MVDASSRKCPELNVMNNDLLLRRASSHHLVYVFFLKRHQRSTQLIRSVYAANTYFVHMNHTLTLMRFHLPSARGKNRKNPYTFSFRVEIHEATSHTLHITSFVYGTRLHDLIASLSRANQIRVRYFILHC
jgi:hypothetical protein